MIAFDATPILAPSLSLERLNEDEGVLLGDREHVVLRGRSVVEVASLVDGRRTKSEILELAVRRVGDLEALIALEWLESSGHLLAIPDRRPQETLAFWHGLGAPLPQALERLREARVDVHLVGRGLGPNVATDVTQALRDVGVAAHPSEDARAPSLDLYVTDEYLSPELELVNRRQLDAKRPWCLVNPVAGTPLVGPLFVPGRGPCWACLAHWLRNNRAVGEHLRRKQGRVEPLAPPNAFLPTTQRIVLGLVAVAIAEALADPARDGALFEHLLAFDWKTLTPERCAVLRRPECPACGDPSLMQAGAGAPIRPRPVPKQRPHQGGYRQQAASVTLEQYERLVGSRTGAISFLQPMPGRYSALRPVYVSAYPKTPSPGSDRLQDCVALCAGKGRSDAQARASALCEALERASGSYRGDEPRVRASLRALGDSALAPERLDLFSARQYANRVALDAANGERARRVPEPLPADTPIDWVRGWSLSRGEVRYIPLCYCFAGAPEESGTAYSGPNGNGVAAGTCLEEAILQGLLELVERDAVAVWWYNGIRRPALDLSRTEDPYVAALLADYASAGKEVWVLDLTHDLGIPVYAALARDPAQGEHAFSMGFGCHLNANVAVERALTELNQIGDGRHPATGKPFVDTRLLPDPGFLYPLGAAHPHESFDGEHLAADIAECQRRLEREGLELIVVDKTRPDLGLSVAQVIVPGLRHFWPRFAPGRLYDVPVRLGWRQTATDEAALTPVALTL